MHHDEQLNILVKLSDKYILDRIKSKFKDILKVKDQNTKYNEIPFDAIKRGPLLVLIIGLSFGCLSFLSEIFIFLSLGKTN